MSRQVNNEGFYICPRTGKMTFNGRGLISKVTHWVEMYLYDRFSGLSREIVEPTADFYTLHFPRECNVGLAIYALADALDISERPSTLVISSVTKYMPDEIGVRWQQRRAEVDEKIITIQRWWRRQTLCRQLFRLGSAEEFISLWWHPESKGGWFHMRHLQQISRSLESNEALNGIEEEQLQRRLAELAEVASLDEPD